MSQIAVIKIGSHSYEIKPGLSIICELMDKEVDSQFTITDIVTISEDGKEALILPSELSNYVVNCTVLKHFRDDKVLVFKKKRRKGYTRTRGHRQYKTIIKIDNIIKN